MQHVSSLGGPRVLLPTKDVERWISELGDEPSPETGLYGLACSVDRYCGIICPWDTPIIIFGDDPADIFWSPRADGGLFIRWVSGDSLEQVTALATSVADANDWSERLEWNSQFTHYTLMDTCASFGDRAPRIALTIPNGNCVIESRYAESDNAMTIVQRLRFLS